MLAHRLIDRRRSLAIRTVLVLCASLAMAAGARLSVHVGPVPLTGQTLVLPLVVALLGTRQSVFAMLAYLAEGAAGLPVFAEGKVGPGVLLGVTAGYLWAYPVAAGVIGLLYERGFATGFARRWIAIFAGTTLIFVSGAAWLAAFVGIPAAVALGVVPFVLGDLAKITVAAGCRNWWPGLAANLKL
ncbi:MAG: biotin transporter BioY [Candidatus Eremiobacteraeota bacterium]|nr:biotin transporter BioY [Candidatus Eremiobacteraeota bacterium]